MWYVFMIGHKSYDVYANSDAEAIEQANGAMENPPVNGWAKTANDIFEAK